MSSIRTRGSRRCQRVINRSRNLADWSCAAKAREAPPVTESGWAGNQSSPSANRTQTSRSCASTKPRSSTSTCSIALRMATPPPSESYPCYTYNCVKAKSPPVSSVMSTPTAATWSFLSARPMAPFAVSRFPIGSAPSALSLNRLACSPRFMRSSVVAAPCAIGAVRVVAALDGARHPAKPHV